MTITQICKKYGISDSYLNSKDDAHSIAATSLIDLKAFPRKLYICISFCGYNLNYVIG